MQQNLFVEHLHAIWTHHLYEFENCDVINSKLKSFKSSNYLTQIRVSAT